MTIVQLDSARAKRMIQELDLSFIEQRLINVEKCEPEYAREAIACYRKLLTLQVDYPGQQLVPPATADRALHAHILYTRQYAESMNAIFGQFLHHDPGNTSPEAREFTRKLFLENFGDNIDSFALCFVSLEIAERRAA